MMRKPPVILLIEDNPDHAELVKRLIKSYRPSARIEHLSDGEAGLDYMLRRGKYSDLDRFPVPGLVLLDLRLPRIDGLDVLKEIKKSKELCRIPVVVLTSSEAEKDIERARRLHANSYLVKPMDLAAFSELIEIVDRYWLDWDRHQPVC